MPPKGGGKFRLEFVNICVLSQLESCISMAYYFNKDPPITLNPEREFNIRREKTQIAKTKQVLNSSH